MNLPDGTAGSRFLVVRIIPLTTWPEYCLLAVKFLAWSRRRKDVVLSYSIQGASAWGAYTNTVKSRQTKRKRKKKKGREFSILEWFLEPKAGLAVFFNQFDTKLKTLGVGRTYNPRP